MAGKVCTKCHTEKDKTEFSSCLGHPEWLRGICRDCKRSRDNEYSRKRNVRDHDKVLSRNKTWVENNRTQHLARMRKYNRDHSDRLAVQAKECRARKIDAYRATARRYAAERMAVDMDFRLKDVLRKRMRNALMGRSKVDRTMGLLGCSMDDLRAHLEGQFVTGMSWDNYGKHGWHIDHIMPCCSFDLSKVEEQRKCFHYTNLRPLWAKDNWAKGAQDRQRALAA